MEATVQKLTLSQPKLMQAVRFYEVTIDFVGQL